MKQAFLYLAALFIATTARTQNSYKDSIDHFITDYVKQHQVVTGENKQYFRFFPADEQYRVAAHFQKEAKSDWFSIPTSSGKTKQYRIYGWLLFTLNGTAQKLAVYQSQFLLQKEEYSDYLFLPFKDATNGRESYETGRYLDLKTTDIKKDTVILDFNKAYNPYCAYVSSGYSCPIPPGENHLKIAINAGEKQFAREH